MAPTRAYWEMTKMEHHPDLVLLTLKDVECGLFYYLSQVHHLCRGASEILGSYFRHMLGPSGSQPVSQPV